MSLLENIAEGFGRAANAPGVVSDIEKRKAERTDLSHLELQTKADQILGDVKQLQARRASLDPKSPTYQQDVAGIDKSLGDHQQAFTDIFHPTKNPTAFQNLGRYLQKHITRKEPTPLPASNEVTPGRMKGLLAGAAIPSSGGTDDAFAKANAQFKAATGRDMTADEKEQWAYKQSGIPQDKPQHFSDYAQGLRRFVQGEGGDPDNPTAAQEQAFRQSRVAQKDKYAWKRDPKTHKVISVKLDANGQIIPGSENDQIAPPPGYEQRITTGQYHFVDEKGQIHEVQETRTSTPAGAMGGGGANIPSTAGAAKQRAAAVAPSGAGRDKVIGFKGNKDYQDTMASYQGAIDRTKTMDQNLTDFLKTGNQQAALSLVANHIGMTLGAQKGARITRAVWDEAIQSAPWVGTVAAKWFHEDTNGDLIFDGYKGGVNLTAEQARQMDRLAHEKTKVLKEHIDRLDQARGAGTTPPPAAPSGGVETKTYQGHTYTRNSPTEPWKLTK